MKGDSPEVIIGCPICRSTAYILDKFLANQGEIQKKYPGSYLILATVETDFTSELTSMLNSYKVRGKVIEYQTRRPPYARSRLWNITCGRETIRNYVIYDTEASYLLFIDSDMTCDPRVIQILKENISGHDVVHSIYKLRECGTNATGLGCSLITRDTLIDNHFHCLEFKNGQVITGEDLFEMNLFRQGRKVKRGYFLTITHYMNKNEGNTVTPRPLSPVKKLANLLFVRYLLIKLSILVHFDIPWHLQQIIAGKRILFRKG